MKHIKNWLTNALISFLMSSSGIGLEAARASKESNRKYDQELKRRFLSPRRLREWREVMGQLEGTGRRSGLASQYGTRYI